MLVCTHPITPTCLYVYHVREGVGRDQKEKKKKEKERKQEKNKKHKKKKGVPNIKDLQGLERWLSVQSACYTRKKTQVQVPGPHTSWASQHTPVTLVRVSREVHHHDSACVSFLRGIQARYCVACLPSQPWRARSRKRQSPQRGHI